MPKPKSLDVDITLPPENQLAQVYNDKDDPTNGEGHLLTYQVRDTPEATVIEEGADKNRGIVSETRKQRKKLQMAGIITPMQEIFIASYVAYRDKKRAAQDAGYSPALVTSIASRLLNESYYPLVARKIKGLLQKQQELAVMDGAAVLKYIHTIMQFSPADWFMPGDDGGWIMDMDDVRVLPAEIKSIIEHIEMKTIEGVDGTRTSKMWVRFVSKTQALAIAARYQLGDLNKDQTPVVQIDWTKLFGRGPVSVTQTTTTTSISSSQTPSKALSNSSSDASDDTFPPENSIEDDPVEARIIKVEAIASKTPVSDKIKKIMDKLPKRKK